MKKRVSLEYLIMTGIVVPTIYLILIKDLLLDGLKNVRFRDSKDSVRRS